MPEKLDIFQVFLMFFGPIGTAILAFLPVILIWILTRERR